MTDPTANDGATVREVLEDGIIVNNGIVQFHDAGDGGLHVSASFDGGYAEMSRDDVAMLHAALGAWLASDVDQVLEWDIPGTPEARGRGGGA